MLIGLPYPQSIDMFLKRESVGSYIIKLFLETHFPNYRVNATSNDLCVVLDLSQKEM